MTVAELIEILKMYPQDIPVTGYHAQEDTGFVTERGISLNEAGGYPIWDDVRKQKYEGPYLDIMGF